MDAAVFWGFKFRDARVRRQVHRYDLRLRHPTLESIQYQETANYFQKWPMRGTNHRGTQRTGPVHRYHFRVRSGLAVIFSGVRFRGCGLGLLAVCTANSRSTPRSDDSGPVYNTADPCRPMLTRADQCGVGIGLHGSASGRLQAPPSPQRVFELDACLDGVEGAHPPSTHTPNCTMPTIAHRARRRLRFGGSSPKTLYREGLYPEPSMSTFG